MIIFPRAPTYVKNSPILDFLIKCKPTIKWILNVFGIPDVYIAQYCISLRFCHVNTFWKRVLTFICLCFHKKIINAFITWGTLLSWIAPDYYNMVSFIGRIRQILLFVFWTNCFWDFLTFIKIEEITCSLKKLGHYNWFEPFLQFM